MPNLTLRQVIILFDFLKEKLVFDFFSDEIRRFQSRNIWNGEFTWMLASNVLPGAIDLEVRSDGMRVVSTGSPLSVTNVLMLVDINEEIMKMLEIFALENVSNL